jgi:leucyl aminopeptidase
VTKLTRAGAGLDRASSLGRSADLSVRVVASTPAGVARAAGDQIAGVLLGNDQALADQVTAAARGSDGPVRQWPLDRRSRKQLDSNVADLRDVGGDRPGAVTAALFLAEFVGSAPWARLDVAGAMRLDADESWRSRGATGLGARPLIDLATGSVPPSS